jgi:hypothetical protein
MKSLNKLYGTYRAKWGTMIDILTVMVSVGVNAVFQS